MAANSIYLIYAGRVARVGSDPESLPIVYQLMLLSHLLAGFVFGVVALFFAFLHFKKMRNRAKPAWMRTSGIFTMLGVLVLFLSGFFILSEANSRDNEWIFISHQATAAIFLITFIVHRLLSRSPPIILNRIGLISISGTAIVAIAVLGLMDSAHSSSQQTDNTNSILDGSTRSDDPLVLARKYFESPVPLTADPSNPFFPSMATTATGGFLPSRILTHDDIPDLELFRAETEALGFAPNHFLGAQSCERCHADIVDQWSKSAHRFSSFNNPFYRKSVELSRDNAGPEASQWCGGCHDPAIMLAGNMTKDIDPLTPESQAGLTCLSCHAIDRVHGLVGNGNYNIHDKTESPYLFDQSKSGVAQVVHDYILKAKPTVHKQRNLKPVFHTSEFCLSCHKVSLDVPVNGYRWLRGQNEYDSWHNSGVALNQPMTWYEPPKSRQCQDCHMPLEDAVKGDVAAKGGKVRSHRFLSANTALPALRGDQDTIDRKEALLRDNMIRLEIFAVRRESGEVILSAKDHDIFVRPGELLQVDVVVRNLGVGHTFPGGTNDSNEGWIDFKASSENGKIFHNGWVGEDRHVDKAAHFYKSVFVDKHSTRISKRNVNDLYSNVYANVIAPSTSDIARYAFRVPADFQGSSITIDASLMWRKFNQEFTEFVFEGKEIPVLPITEIEHDSIVLKVAKESATRSLDPLPDDDKRWMRFNDYGIGSVMDEDTKSAVSAFTKVTELSPQKMDGWLNLARAYLTAGDLQKAEGALRKASEAEPDQPRLAFFWGVLLERSGRLDEAVLAYQRTLQHYPNSRDTLVRLGRAHWLTGNHNPSIEAYLKVLSIDPEHAQAHHQLSLSFSALASEEVDANRKNDLEAMAHRFQASFDKYKLDENAARVTHKYRENNAADNKMSQRIVVHDEG